MYRYVICLCSLYWTIVAKFPVCLHHWFASETCKWQRQVHVNSIDKDIHVYKSNCHNFLHQTLRFWNCFAYHPNFLLYNIFFRDHIFSVDISASWQAE